MLANLSEFIVYRSRAKARKLLQKFQHEWTWWPTVEERQIRRNSIHCRTIEQAALLIRALHITLRGRTSWNAGFSDLRNFGFHLLPWLCQRTRNPRVIWLIKRLRIAKETPDGAIIPPSISSDRRRFSALNKWSLNSQSSRFYGSVCNTKSGMK